jgi:CubicO group peptidase (beta-lactamase class C family)
VVLYEKSFGYANLRKKDSLEAHHAFQLASLSKPFTAIAVLQLIEQKKISLDDSIQRYIPDFPYHGILIKSLLSHRSGLPNYAYSFPDSVRYGKLGPSNQEMLNWFAKADPLPARYNYPNRSFNYCNTNYLVLAALVEKVSGISFEEYVEKNIFKPLGMSHTFLATEKVDSSRFLKTDGHQYGRVLPKDYFDNIVGDKGIYSTTEDLYRFYKGLLGGCLVQKKTLKEAFMPRSFERRGMKNYGYGFRMHLDEHDTPKYLYHTGWWKGYNTIMWMSEKDDFVIIILSNSYNRTIYQIKPLLDVLHGTVQSDDVEKDI